MMPKKASPVPTDSAPTGGGGAAPPEFIFLGNTSQEVMSSMQIQGLGAS